MKWKLLTLDSITGYTVNNPTRTKYHRFEKFEDANDFYQKNKTTSFASYRHQNWLVAEEVPDFHETVDKIPSGYYAHAGAWNNGNQIEVLVPAAIRTDGLKFQHDAYGDIMKDMDSFLKNEALYRKADALHRRSYLFHGIPGTGKTTIIRTVIQSLKDDAIIITLSKPPSREFIDALNVDKRLKIILFEELTTGLSDPSDVKAILDFLDGERSIDHCIVVATTNYPADLPDNLVDRKGRFDVIMEIGLLSPDSSAAFAENVLKRKIEQPEREVIIKMNMAEIKDACLRNIIDNKSFVDYDKELQDHKRNKTKMFEKKGDMGFKSWG